MSRIGTILGALSLFAFSFSFSSVAAAGEADDLQRMIDTARQAANDLERLDEQKAVREELTLLRVWLDAAWRLRSEQKYDEVRVVLDRCQAQGDMIRQKIIAAKASSEAARKEDELKRVRDKIAKTMEGKVK
jgi:site-specific recombinase